MGRREDGERESGRGLSILSDGHSMAVKVEGLLLASLPKSPGRRLCVVLGTIMQDLS